MTNRSFASCVLRFALLSIFASVLSGQEVVPPPTAQQPPDPLAHVVPDLSSSRLAAKIEEDFSTPALTHSNLRPVAPLPLEADDFASFRREVVRVEWRPGDAIDLYIVRPVAGKKPPAILYLYSYPFEMDRFLDNNFCDFLVRDGVAAVGFASALTGSRYRTGRPMKEWFVSELNESLATTSHDVQMILNYMNARGDFDMNRLGSFGEGSGASIAILAAAVEPRIKTLDLLNPWGDWPDWAARSTLIPENERPDYLRPEWLASVAPLDPVRWLPQLTSKKIRLSFIKDMAITPPDVQAKLEASAPPNAETLHYETGAAFNSAIAGGTGFDWIKQQVRGDTKDYRTAQHMNRSRRSSSRSQ